MDMRALRALFLRCSRAAGSFVAVILVLTAFGARSAAAAGSVDDDDCTDMSVVDDVVGAGLADVGAAVHEVVVPCAVVDSGALGADCQDASFYVVNQTGTLLCHVDVAVFQNASSAPAVDNAPAAPAAALGVMPVAMLSPASLLPPPPGYFERSLTLIGPALSASDAHVHFRPRPS